MLCVARQSLRRLAGFFCVFMQKDLVFNSFLEYNLDMATVTQDQLAEFAHKAALNNQESENCPTSSGENSASRCSASWVLQAKDPFKGWETWGEGVTREEAHAWKARKESEPEIYCKMEYRIFELP